MLAADSFVVSARVGDLMVVLQHAQAVAVGVGLFFAETFAVESEVVHHVRAVRGIVADADSALLYE